MKIKALGNRILVNRIKAKTATDSGILLPDGDKFQVNHGTVLSIGSEVTLPIKVGDEVVFEQTFSISQIFQDDIIALKQDEIVGVVVES